MDSPVRSMMQSLKSLFVKPVWKKISFRKELLYLLQSDLQKVLHTPSQPAVISDSSERAIVERIRQRTFQNNRNNVTRTKAYWEYYMRNPEVHWAYLAHMVSRNAGYNMTDLKGSLLAKVLNKQLREDFFLFLERANSFIFSDAYPQLLLYEEGKEKGRNFSHLLKSFHVSSFMNIFWNGFLEDQNSQLLTVALIINEQHYIERRVVHHPFFQDKVVSTTPFQLQDFLHIGQILFPYDFRDKGLRLEKLPKLTGLNVGHFTKIGARIELGKQLYALLFGYPTIYRGTKHFASEKNHTGSRADYWDDVFTKIPHRILPGIIGPKVYSPTLMEAWEDLAFQPPVKMDWFSNMDVLSYFGATKTPRFSCLTYEAYGRITGLDALSDTINLVDKTK